ncbi:MAG TPA: GNAT family N-acetyltransferase [Dongiaceae bacterium]|nr:GNAT family N-acetyltransferase [Dongiaceae bacterium]
MQVRDAGPGEMEGILRASHAVWSEGMAVEEYLAFNLEQRDSPWGRERYRFLVAEDSGRRVAALKLFTLPGELDARAITIAGLGAVFTLPEARGRGVARALVDAALPLARAAGADLALLMSEIGPDLYLRSGFETIPALESGCLPFLPVPWAGEPAWLRADRDPGASVPGLRPFEPADLDALVAIHEEAGRGQRFRLRRDPPAWEQTFLRSTLRRRFLRGQDDQVLVIEAERRDGAASKVLAYAVLREVPGGLEWREHGARLGAEERLVDLFWTAIAQARRRGVNRIDAWQFPAIVTTRRVYPIAVRPLKEPSIMLRRLDPEMPPLAFDGPEECRVSWLDLF